MKRNQSIQRISSNFLPTHHFELKSSELKSFLFHNPNLNPMLKAFRLEFYRREEEIEYLPQDKNKYTTYK